jgi:hypothetical protein
MQAETEVKWSPNRTAIRPPRPIAQTLLRYYDSLIYMATRIPHGEPHSPGHRCRALLDSVLPRPVEIAVAGPDRLVVNGTVLRVAWAGDGWLPDVRRVLDTDGDRPQIVAARRMSPGARATLTDAGIGWVDETGATEIAIGPIIVVRPGLADSSRRRPAGWTAATEAVAEALLCGVSPTVDAAVSATGLSTGSCVAALRSLTDLGLLAHDAERGRDSARRLDDRDRLLDAYSTAAAARKRPSSIRVGVTWRDVVEGTITAGKAWTAAGISWAATGVVASEVIAPHLTSVNTADVYVSGHSLTDLARAAEVAGLRPIEGGRLQLIAFPTAATGRLIEQAGEMMVAPWPRVFADLRQSGVRGEDVAEHLRETYRGR